MSLPDITSQLQKYQNSSPEQLAIMQVLAVLYGHASTTQLLACLGSLGIKISGNAAAHHREIKKWLEPLLKAKLITTNSRSALRCNALLAEPIARHLVDDGRFEAIVAVIDKHIPLRSSYYRYNNIEDCLRDARIQFHRGQYDAIQTCLTVHYIYQGKISLEDFWLLVTLQPFDGDWLMRRHAAIAPKLLFCSLQYLQLYLEYNAEILSFAEQQIARAEWLEPDYQVQRMIAEHYLLRGEWHIVRRYVEQFDAPELQAIAACLSFLDGDYQTAIVEYENALKAHRKLTGKRTGYFAGLAGIFYPLAILKNNDSKQLSKLSALLAQALRSDGIWQSIYRYLTLFCEFQRGDIALRETLMQLHIDIKHSQGFTPDGKLHTLNHPPLLAQLFLTLIKFWTNAGAIAKISSTTKQLYSRLQQNGYVWPAAELAKVFSQVTPGKQEQWDCRFVDKRNAALADLFASRPDWDLALDALLNLQPSAKKTGSVQRSEAASSRLIWLIDFDESSNAFSLEAREQKPLQKGGWSKGKIIAPKRLRAESGSLDYFTAQDRKICSHIHEYRDGGWYGSGTYFAFDNTTALDFIGHPLLFLAHNPDVRVDIVRGDVELRVNKQGNSAQLKISLEPAPKTEQAKVSLIKETPTRFKVVEFTPEHHKILSVLGQTGLIVPESAKERVLQALTGISGLLTVHSDIGGSSSTAEQVAADAMPRIHLLPFGEGLRVALLVRPFANGGAYYRPGRGGESVLAEIDGKPLQAQRDFALEKQRSEAVLQACPVLAEAQCDESGEWLLDNPEDSLELLLQLQTLDEPSVLIEWPEGVKFRLLGQSDSRVVKLRVQRDNDWFGLQGEVIVNEDTVLEIQQLLGLLDSQHGRFLQLQDGQFIALTEAFRRRLDDLRAYADVTGKKVRINPLAAFALADWSDEVGGFKADKYWREHLQRLQTARDYQPTLASTFQAELREYQMDGYIWLARLAQWGVGACLADDMGLGKTVQALALLVNRAPAGPGLIIAPTSVCTNWEIEARRFAPTLQPKLLSGGDRQQLLDNLAPFDLLICSYGLLQQEQVADMLAKVRFQTAILDEAQAIKNVATRRSQGAMNLQAEFKLIMTGTPLENHLGELWNLFRFINPGLLGSMEQFNQRYAGPIERDRNVQARQQLKRLIQPFILRRTKSQVLQDLPPRTEIPIYVELSQEEMAFYEALRRESLALLSNTEGPSGQKHLQILAAITKLRRSCCNTRLANADICLPSSKLAAFGDILDELLDNKHKALVFSQFVDHLHIIREYLDARGVHYQYLDGSTPGKERQQRVNAFQCGEGDLFLISLKAGGVGLNLTAADYVIHMDPWWNPAVEDQASDRAHRMGQQRPVTIYRMIAKQTIEEKIVALHSHKRDLADSLLEGAEISGKMSADDLLDLMRAETPS